MTTFNEILDAAQTLAPSDRLRLSETLWETVPVADWPAPSREWVAEVQRRSDELDAGNMTTSTWEDVRDRARKRAGLDG
jgi:putative addiction module component (TIGR02574 family)